MALTWGGPQTLPWSRLMKSWHWILIALLAQAGVLLLMPSCGDLGGRAIYLEVPLGEEGGEAVLPFEPKPEISVISLSLDLRSSDAVIQERLVRSLAWSATCSVLARDASGSVGQEPFIEVPVLSEELERVKLTEVALESLRSRGIADVYRVILLHAGADEIKSRSIGEVRVQWSEGLLQECTRFGLEPVLVVNAFGY